MAHYAMVVVVEADLVTQAQGVVETLLSLQDPDVQTRFVGTPWQIVPIGDQIVTPVATYELEFDTLDCIRQHPLNPVE